MVNDSILLVLVIDALYTVIITVTYITSRIMQPKRKIFNCIRYLIVLTLIRFSGLRPSLTKICMVTLKYE